MINKDEALTISNPRLLSAAYFVLLAVVATIIIDLILYGIGVEKILPTFEAILLAVIIAGCFGALFGKRIIYCTKPYRRKAFLWGFVMVLAALPIYDLFFFYLFKEHHPHAFEGLNISNILVTYLLILLYSLLFAGLWLAIAAGLAAMYLRGHIVYDILHSKHERLKSSFIEKTKEAQKKPKAVKPQRPNRAHITH